MAIDPASSRATSIRLLIACLLLTPAVQAAEVDTVTASACPGYAAWARTHGSTAKFIAESPVTGTDTALKAQLHDMVTEDQQARQAWIASGMDHPDPIVLNHMEVVDARNAKALRRIVDAGGMPTPQRVGRQGMNDFWLLVQHDVADIPLQERVLQALSSGDSGVPRSDIALLTDRILDHQGHPQRYGSQFHFSAKGLAAAPIEDEAHVDERRAAMDLAPLADYACVLRQIYKQQPAPSSAPGESGQRH